MEKLVRDRVPDLIRANGGRPRIRRARSDEYVWLLRRKLVEEAQEVLTSDDRDGTLHELADVCEIVLALATAIGSSTDEIEHYRRAKKRERGGFADAIVLDEQTSAEP